MNNNQIIVIDAGNTFVKIGVFTNGKLEGVECVSFDNFVGDEKLLSTYNYSNGIFSSVLSIEQNQLIRERFPKFIHFNNQLQLPIQLNYHTPETLGNDRLCNAIATWKLNQNNDSLSVDIGTCIKFDFVDATGVYQGGSISPGIRLRYQSMNDYTANLPLLNEMGQINLIGKSTKDSMHSGVINGINAEILRLIQEYEEKYNSLTIFVTGGDAKYFDIATKNNIFANENLTLYGLYETFLLNAK
ncbi:MAG: type III pantothenate kinase [Crocinitomicaceae bacterium]|nr:type III pantothenate kinase [Crocinitomicaceae bacterium]